MAVHTFSSSPLVPFSASQKPHSSLPFPLSSSFQGRKLQNRHFNLILKCHPMTIFAMSSALPTKKHSSEEIPKWSSRAIRSYTLGILEARKLKYLECGTEALLMGILMEGTSPAAKFLRNNGITFYKVREETLKLLGKSDFFVITPENLPLSEQAQRAIDWAIDEKIKSGDSGEITTTHLLLAMWSDKESAGRRILENLGFSDEKAKELAEAKNEDMVSVR